MKPLHVICPFCGAKVGKRCVVTDTWGATGRPSTRIHRRREVLARAAAIAVSDSADGARPLEHGGPAFWRGVYQRVDELQPGDVITGPGGRARSIVKVERDGDGHTVRLQWEWTSGRSVLRFSSLLTFAGWLGGSGVRDA